MSEFTAARAHESIDGHRVLVCTMLMLRRSTVKVSWSLDAHHCRAARGRRASGFQGSRCRLGIVLSPKLSPPETTLPPQCRPLTPTMRGGRALVFDAHAHCQRCSCISSS